MCMYAFSIQQDFQTKEDPLPKTVSITNISSTLTSGRCLPVIESLLLSWNFNHHLR